MRDAGPADVLGISGPAGVGKSSVALETSYRLQVAGVDHVLIDTDELDRIYPVPDDLWAVTQANLRALWRTFEARGARRFILVGVYLDQQSELRWLSEALPDARLTLVRLEASEATLLGRVRRREIGSALEMQVEHTLRQVAELRRDPAPVSRSVATDGRSIVEVADEILAIWLGEQSPRPSAGSAPGE